ncbi:MAG: hypothetical protein I8N66_11330 [Ensifer sp. SSB1]|nr:hypothetical protein [Ensifer sp. SSB1]
MERDDGENRHRPQSIKSWIVVQGLRPHALSQRPYRKMQVAASTCRQRSRIESSSQRNGT